MFVVGFSLTLGTIFTCDFAAGVVVSSNLEVVAVVAAGTCKLVIVSGALNRVVDDGVFDVVLVLVLVAVPDDFEAAFVVAGLGDSEVNVIVVVPVVLKLVFVVPCDLVALVVGPGALKIVITFVIFCDSVCGNVEVVVVVVVAVVDVVVFAFAMKPVVVVIVVVVAAAAALGDLDVVVFRSDLEVFDVVSGRLVVAVVPPADLENVIVVAFVVVSSDWVVPVVPGVLILVVFVSGDLVVAVVVPSGLVVVSGDFVVSVVYDLEVAFLGSDALAVVVVVPGNFVVGFSRGRFVVGDNVVDDVFVPFNLLVVVPGDFVVPVKLIVVDVRDGVVVVAAGVSGGGGGVGDDGGFAVDIAGPPNVVIVVISGDVVPASHK